MKFTVQIYFVNSSVEFKGVDLETTLKIEKTFKKRKVHSFRQDSNRVMLIDFSQVSYIDINLETPREAE